MRKLNFLTFLKRFDGHLLVLAIIAISLALGINPASTAKNANGARRSLSGVVEGNGQLQRGYEVSLYASFSSAKGRHSRVVGLGRDTTDDSGHFKIHYKLAPGHKNQSNPVLYILAEKGESMLASVLDDTTARGSITLNERTTVATGVAFAQFVDGRVIKGNRNGMFNAVRMAGNMADPVTGAVGEVLDSSPNADETSTRKTFNSMANIVASCVAQEDNCETLFDYATPRGGETPRTVLQALANMTRYASTTNVPELFELAAVNPIYAPALPYPGDPPTSWLLFIKITGDRTSRYTPLNLMAGPGNLAFDARGYAWVNNNYIPTFDLEISCASNRVMQFYPWGASVPKSPFFGGGLSGAGFGITLDPRGRVWVGNFGFEAPNGACESMAAPHDSVSVFRPNGVPVTGSDGYTDGHIWWPQATVSDKKGDIWLANCGNDTVTFLPKSKASKARNIALPGGQGADHNYKPSHRFEGDSPRLKPFAIAIDPMGRAWVTANLAPGEAQNMDGTPVSGRVFRISPDGSVEALTTLDARSRSVLSWPMGISGDSEGNMWVSNSNSVNVPCVDPLDPQNGEQGASVAFYPADGGTPSFHQGGGLTIPWGNAVDGNDTLWVFNFGQHPIDGVTGDTEWPDTPLSHFCGADPARCPPGFRKGEAISPPMGYVSDAVDRVTGGQIDPSGNVWLLNNWKKTGPYGPVYDTNPGGNSLVIIPGAAGPVKTPLIGPPRSF